MGGHTDSLASIGTVCARGGGGGDFFENSVLAFIPRFFLAGMCGIAL